MFSLASDVVKRRHGVPELYDLLAEDPEDPQRALWLAEAIARAKASMSTYARIRSITSPTFAIINQSARASTQIGQ